MNIQFLYDRFVDLLEPVADLIEGVKVTRLAELSFYRHCPTIWNLEIPVAKSGLEIYSLLFVTAATGR